MVLAELTRIPMRQRRGSLAIGNGSLTVETRLTDNCYMQLL